MRTRRLFDGNGGRSNSGSLEVPDWIGRPSFARLPHSSHPSTSIQSMGRMSFCSTTRCITDRMESFGSGATSPTGSLPPSPSTCTYRRAAYDSRGERKQRAGPEREKDGGECVDDDIGTVNTRRFR